MSTAHNHTPVCQHQHLAFCSHCQVVYCKDCGKEWRDVPWHTWQYQPGIGSWYQTNVREVTTDPAFIGSASCTKCSHSG